MKKSYLGNRIFLAAEFIIVKNWDLYKCSKEEYV